MMIRSAISCCCLRRPQRAGWAEPRFEDRVLEITPETRAGRSTPAWHYLASKQTARRLVGRALRGKNTGVVSFAVLSFMSTGVVPGRGPQGKVVARGIDYVLSNAQLNGLISNPQDTANGPMYEHAMSTLLLAEAWGMYHRPGILDALQRAVDLILSSQNDQGGWRYEPRPADADISVTVMQLVALRAAKDAGIRVPQRSFEAAISYVKSCAMPSGGFLYQPGVGAVGYARTAAGVCSLLACGDFQSPQAPGRPGLSSGAQASAHPGPRFAPALRDVLCRAGDVPGRRPQALAELVPGRPR